MSEPKSVKLKRYEMKRQRRMAHGLPPPVEIEIQRGETITAAPKPKEEQPTMPQQTALKSNIKKK